MSPEMEHSDFRERFEAILETGNDQTLSEFLDDQNISDVAELIDDQPDHELAIISSMSVHRAASVFKILELTHQNIKKLPP
jgi:magnesium transporter